VKNVHYFITRISAYFSKWPWGRENRNDHDLVQAFLKKWWVESDFKAILLQYNS
jgi:hypothetical protein